MTNPLITKEQIEKIDNLMDLLIDKMKLKNDAALARALGVAPPVVSKTRSGSVGMSTTMLVRMSDASGLTINYLREQVGIAPLTPAYAAM